MVGADGTALFAPMQWKVSICRYSGASFWSLVFSLQLVSIMVGFVCLFVIVYVEIACLTSSYIIEKFQ